MLKHAEVTEQVIQAYYKVYNQLGYGFLEKVYQNALVLELRRRGLRAEPRWPINVYYEGELVGEYYADVLVNDCVILELKAIERLCEEHHALFGRRHKTRYRLGDRVRVEVARVDLQRRMLDFRLAPAARAERPRHDADERPRKGKKRRER